MRINRANRVQPILPIARIGGIKRQKKRAVLLRRKKKGVEGKGGIVDFYA